MAAAAPKPVPRSVKNLVKMPSDSTQSVLFDRVRARSASFAANAPLWPKDLSVGKPCTASRNSSPNALKAAARAMAPRLSALWISIGKASVASAATSITAAVGTSHQASTVKITNGDRKSVV